MEQGKNPLVDGDKLRAMEGGALALNGAAEDYDDMPPSNPVGTVYHTPCFKHHIPQPGGHRID